VELTFCFVAGVFDDSQSGAVTVSNAGADDCAGSQAIACLAVGDTPGDNRMLDLAALCASVALCCHELDCSDAAKDSVGVCHAVAQHRFDRLLVAEPTCSTAIRQKSNQKVDILCAYLPYILSN
jgi:hypothetical protein